MEKVVVGNFECEISGREVHDDIINLDLVNNGQMSIDGLHGVFEDNEGIRIVNGNIVVGEFYGYTIVSYISALYDYGTIGVCLKQESVENRLARLEEAVFGGDEPSTK